MYLTLHITRCDERGSVTAKNLSLSLPIIMTPMKRVFLKKVDIFSVLFHYYQKDNKRGRANGQE